MRHSIFNLAVLAASLAFTATASANGFEGNGIIEKVELSNNLITVNEETFKLPNSIVVEGNPAILQVKPGYQIGFSGEIGTPYPVISSVYIYPDSVCRVEMGLEP